MPATWVRFTFSASRGFHGLHGGAVLAVGEEHTPLRHALALESAGPARLTWPFLWRSLRNALLEDGLDRAELACTGTAARLARWGRYVRLLGGLAG